MVLCLFFLACSKTTKQPEKVSWELCVFLVDSAEANIAHKLIAFHFMHVKKGIFVTLLMDGCSRILYKTQTRNGTNQIIRGERTRKKSWGQVFIPLSRRMVGKGKTPGSLGQSWGLGVNMAVPATRRFPDWKLQTGGSVDQWIGALGGTSRGQKVRGDGLGDYIQIFQPFKGAFDDQSWTGNMGGLRLRSSLQR